MTERQFQDTVLILARTLGWRCFHVHDSRRQVRPGVLVGDRDTAGWPDLVLAHPRRGVLFRELKTDRGRLNPAQREWLELLDAAGADSGVWRPGDLDRIQSKLGGSERS